MKFLIVSAVLLASVSAFPQDWNNLFLPVNGQQQQAGQFRPGQRPAQQVQFPINNNPFFPQNTGNGDDNADLDASLGQIFGMSSTTPAPNQPTTSTPQFLDCMQRCPSTNEYNPICGTDSINYHNNGRLQCAINCGKNVAAVRLGTCRPL